MWRCELLDRILIVGYGSIGRRHLRIVRESHPSSSIMVLRHQPTEDIPEFADFVTSSMDDVHAFLPQVAVVANPAPFHLKIAKNLVKLGCHLLIEKPISDAVDDVADFLELIRASDVVCQVGYNLRFLPSLSRFHDLIKEGLVGEPLSVRCEFGQYLPSWRLDADYRLGVSARRELGGGVLLEISHEIDYLRWIFGDIEWVSAWVGAVGNLEIDVEDTAHLAVSFKSEGRSRPLVANLNLDFIRHDTTRFCTVIGSNGSLRWNALNGAIDIYKPSSNVWEEFVTIPNDRDDSYYLQWRNFITNIRKRSQPFADARAGLEVLKIVEAAKESGRSNGVRIWIK